MAESGAEDEGQELDVLTGRLEITWTVGVIQFQVKGEAPAVFAAYQDFLDWTTERMGESLTAMTGSPMPPMRDGVPVKYWSMRD